MNQDNSRPNASEQAETEMPLFSPFRKLDGNLPLSQELIQFSDDLTEFICINAFMCDAFSNILAKQEAMNDESARGALYCAESLKTKSFELRAALDQVRERYLAEHE
ncbi:MAG TPA: hypothetical protein VF296_05255 [Gallionella sp.]